MGRFLFILIFTIAASAQASHPFETPTALHLSSTVPTTLKVPVKVSIKRDDDILVVNFDVQSKTLNAKKQLEKNEYPYQYDVVELFVSAEAGFPYYEFEVSPYNQSLEVRIENPKKKFETLKENFEHEAHLTPQGWTAMLKIPLKSLNWNGSDSEIVGNAYAILGKSPRSFWSLFLPQSKKVNFHQPQFFKPLL